MVVLVKEEQPQSGFVRTTATTVQCSANLSQKMLSLLRRFNPVSGPTRQIVRKFPRRFVMTKSDEKDCQASQKDASDNPTPTNPQENPKGNGNVVTDKANLYPFRKARKVAVMVSFCGKNYLGMQRQAK